MRETASHFPLAKKFFRALEKSLLLYGKKALKDLPSFFFLDNLNEEIKPRTIVTIV